jgi:hypothetical protein
LEPPSRWLGALVEALAGAVAGGWWRVWAGGNMHAQGECSWVARGSWRPWEMDAIIYGMPEQELGREVMLRVAVQDDEVC